MLTHKALYDKARTKTGYNFTPLLKELTPFLQNDIDICHLETPITYGAPRSYPVFATPHQIVKAIKDVGFEGCSLASNHSLDQKEKGLILTKRELIKNNLGASGTKTDEDDTATAYYLTKQAKVAHISYSYSTNGITNKNKLVNAPININSIIKDAQKAKNNGANLIILSLHFGSEYVAKPSSYQRKVVRKITSTKLFNAIIGHHAHVAQPAEIINGLPVLYGLGNLFSGQGGPAKQARQWGVLATLTFSLNNNEYKMSKLSALPVIMDQRSYKAVPAVNINSDHHLAKLSYQSEITTEKLYSKIRKQLTN
ncbi:MAG: CapA family protein, partial [Candidatus Paceibacterota bacterium]